MYFKVSGRHNPHTGKNDWYYRLVESYRNSDGRVCHRTMLNVGFLEADVVSSEQMSKIQKILTHRVEQAQTQKTLFDTPLNEDPVVNQYVECYYKRLVAEKRIDIFQEKTIKKPYAKGKDLEIIDLNSIRNKDVREIGAEWMSYQATEQLQIRYIFRSIPTKAGATRTYSWLKPTLSVERFIRHQNMKHLAGYVIILPFAK